jgi:hypothetical protein
MGPTRMVLLKLTDGHELTLVALATTAAGVLGALALRRAVEGTALGFLFTRPEMFRLVPGRGYRSSRSPAVAAGPAE